MTYDEHDHEAGTAALAHLADELGARGYEAALIAAEGRRPSLAVRNPAAPMLAENVVADSDRYWWSWADKIAPLTDVAAAADRVARVLAAESGPSHE